jgi:hypothetical protein
MSSKYLFIPCLLVIVSAGCTVLERQPPEVATAPPYWQSQSELAQDQLDEMRAFHDKESAKMMEEMHVFRNREMERLANAGKELERDKRWQEDYEKTLQRREKWTSWFKKKNKEEDRNDAPSVSGTSKTVR